MLASSSPSSFVLNDYKSVELLTKHLKTKIVDTNTVKKLVDLASQYWEGKEVHFEEWNQTGNSSYLPPTIHDELFSGILNLMLSVMRIPEKSFSSESVFKDLIQIGFSEEEANQILEMKATKIPNIPTALRLMGVQWRIDVKISTRIKFRYSALRSDFDSILVSNQKSPSQWDEHFKAAIHKLLFPFFSWVNRVLEPWILMELKLEGHKKTIHIPLSQFHSLRFQVAQCLSKMNQIST